MRRFAISFDDGLMPQFKWARGLWRYGIRGTFYVNPFYIGFREHLMLDHLKRMRDEFGHTIANHFWLHECPRNFEGINDEIVKKILRRNLSKASEWLEENGFGDGKRLVALPYGSNGGGWNKEWIEEILEDCDQVRDVNCDGINLSRSRVLRAVEYSPDSRDVFGMTSKMIDAPDESLVCYYFHHNLNTKDDDFIDLIEWLMDSYQPSSMIEEAKNVSM